MSKFYYGKINKDELKILQANKQDFIHGLSVKNISSAKLLNTILVIGQIAMLIAGFIIFDFTHAYHYMYIAGMFAIVLFCLAYNVITALIFQKDTYKYRNHIYIATIIFSIAILCVGGYLSLLDIFLDREPIVFLAIVASVAGSIYLRPIDLFASFAGILTAYLLVYYLALGSVFKTLEFICYILYFVIMAIISYEKYISRIRDYLLTNEILCKNSDLQDVNKQLISLNNRLEDISYKDRLTGLYNRWSYNKNLESLFEKCKEAQKLMSLAIFDLDNFKMINDEHGHSVGDACLISVANIISAHLDWLKAYRYGGEEFILLFEDLTEDEVFDICESIRKKVEKNTHSAYNLPLTVSCGIYSRTPDEDTNIESYLVKADRAMYVAKLEGKNKVVKYVAAK